MLPFARKGSKLYFSNNENYGSMPDHFVDDQHFQDVFFAESGFTTGHYDGCTFERCDFTGTSLADCVFVDCRFKSCNLSGTLVLNTAFREVRFEECKALGVQWTDTNPMLLAMEFEDCQLDLGNFVGCPLAKSSFQSCTLPEADFAEADLSGVALTKCELAGAQFEQSDLSGADLSSASNYRIDPEQNRIEGTKVSWPEAMGLLHKYGLKWE